MGGTGSSSRRKLSKKRYKKKGGKKESKRSHRVYDSDDDSLNSEHTSSSDQRRKINKKKKLRRTRDYSVSSYSVDSGSDSESSYDERRKSKRSRVTKKRSRRRSASPNAKKRKRSGKERVVKGRKKSSKKKARRHLSSCASSDSESSDRKRRRSEVIPDKEMERCRGREHEKRRERSPSCDRGEVGDHSLSAIEPVNNTRRLKSVILVVERSDDGDEGENRYERDPYKEEIVYDPDDYPSPKSVDSERFSVENVTGEDDQKNDNVVKEKEIDTPAPVVDDLESILRQKALENLRRFRGGIQTGPGSTNMERNDDSGSSSAPREMNKRRRTSSNGEFSPSDVATSQAEPVSRSGTSPEGVGEMNKRRRTSSNGEFSPSDVATSQAVPVSRSGTSPEGVATNACSSAPGEPSSSEHHDGSQYEQKTMTVMRGGELVQVSYKVYIPKKIPALARRQLNR